jgi:hypothetical protein
MDADRRTILLIERSIGFVLKIDRLRSTIVTLSEETHADPSSIVAAVSSTVSVSMQ